MKALCLAGKKISVIDAVDHDKKGADAGRYRLKATAAEPDP
jgi:hypothetical protein